MPRLLLLLISFAALLFAQPRTDQQIDAEIRARLARSVIGKNGFTARVKDGVVYWEGSTPVAQHKGAATRMAKSSGARRVVNNIRVAKGSARPTGRPKAAVAPPAPAPVPAPPPAPAAAPVPLPKATVKWRENP